jgi:hypothetical protein
MKTNSTCNTRLHPEVRAQRASKDGLRDSGFW